MIEIQTDFAFKGEREYIHSTTLIEALADVVDTHFVSRGEWGFPRVDAQFHREIGTNGTFRISGENEDMTGDGPVASRLVFHDGSTRVEAHFWEDEKRNVRHRKQPRYAVEEVALEEELGGQYLIDGSHRVNLVENVIEANKRLHLAALGEGKDLKVMNLYVKKFPIALNPQQIKNPDNLLLHIQNLSSRQLADAMITLNSLHFPETDMDPFEMCFVVYGL